MKSFHSLRRLPAVAILTLAAIAAAQETKLKFRSLAPYVPTPPMVVERMLELAGVQKGDTVYDLGSGDGRIVITAAQEYGARAVGVEIDGKLVERARARVKELNLEDRIEIIHGHLLDVDLSPASVVTLYLLTSANRLLRPNLEKSLKPGSRVVSHDFTIEGWTPMKTEKLTGKGRTHTIYLYEIGKQ